MSAKFRTPCGIRPQSLEALQNPFIPVTDNHYVWKQCRQNHSRKYGRSGKFLDDFLSILNPEKGQYARL